MSGSTPTPTRDRKLQVVVRDQCGDLLKAAEIEFEVDGRSLGRVFTGSGVSESTITVASTATITVVITALDGTSLTGYAPPGTDSLDLQLNTVPLIKAKIPPIATCPDGTTGNPCVTCRDGNEVWQICT